MTTLSVVSEAAAVAEGAISASGFAVGIFVEIGVAVGAAAAVAGEIDPLPAGALDWLAAGVEEQPGSINKVVIINKTHKNNRVYFKIPLLTKRIESLLFYHVSCCVESVWKLLWFNRTLRRLYL